MLSYLARPSQPAGGSWILVDRFASPLGLVGGLKTMRPFSFATATRIWRFGSNNP